MCAGQARIDGRPVTEHLLLALLLGTKSFAGGLPPGAVSWAVCNLNIRGDETLIVGHTILALKIRPRPTDTRGMYSEHRASSWHGSPCFGKLTFTTTRWQNPAETQPSNGLTLLPYVSANGNSTAEPDTKSVPCPEYTENCTEISSPSKWRSHFSRCPKTYRHYCVKGKCRYVSAEKTPACICESGYTGSRCEYLDLFYLKGDRGQLVVIGMIAAMVTLIVLIISLCICSHHCRRLRRRKMKAKVIDTMDNDCAVPIEETQLA